MCARVSLPAFAEDGRPLPQPSVMHAPTFGTSASATLTPAAAAPLAGAGAGAGEEPEGEVEVLPPGWYVRCREGHTGGLCEAQSADCCGCLCQDLKANGCGWCAGSGACRHKAFHVGASRAVWDNALLC